MGFLDSLVLKNLAANARHTRDKGLIPGWERSPRGGNGNPLQCPYLGSPMERGAWWATVHGVTKSWTRLRGWMHTRAHTHTHTHTVMCLPIFFIFQMVSWCSVCALQKKGTRSGCYLCNWYWQQLRNRTDRTCGNHHNFATVSAIRTQAPQTWQWDWSVSGCNDDKVYLTITNFILADVLL